MKGFWKILGHKGPVPTWAKNDTLKVPTRHMFVDSSNNLINHWYSNFNDLIKDDEKDKPRGFIKVRNNTLFNNLESLLMSLDEYEVVGRDNRDMTNLFDKALNCHKLVDIYKVTGKLMRKFNQRGMRETFANDPDYTNISRGKNVIRHAPEDRSLRDCSDFTLIRAIHWASADKIGRLFPGSGNISTTDRGHQLMQNTHLTGLGHHGFDLDHRADITPNLCYLETDKSSAAFRISIENGNLKWSPNPLNLNYKENFHTLEWVRTDRKYSPDNNTAHQPEYHGPQKGVAGFCMTLNHQLFATKHQLVQARSGYFYHSSYIAGNDILCTGCIQVKDGRLKAIDNISGHYMPSTEKLVLVIRHLESKGVPVEKLQVFTVANRKWQLANVLLDDEEILSNTYNKSVPVHKSSEITAALQSYSSRWKTKVTASKESKDAINNMKLRNGAALVEMAMFYAYKSSTNTSEEIKYLSVFGSKHNLLPLKDISELRTRLQSVLGPNLEAAWAS